METGRDRGGDRAPVGTRHLWGQGWGQGTFPGDTEDSDGDKAPAGAERGMGTVVGTGHLWGQRWGHSTYRDDTGVRDMVRDGDRIPVGTVTGQ